MKKVAEFGFYLFILGDYKLIARLDLPEMLVETIVVWL